MAFSSGAFKQLATRLATGWDDTTPLLHENDATPNEGASRSLASALVPVAVTGVLAVQIAPATAQVTVLALQSPSAGDTGGAGGKTGTGETGAGETGAGETGTGETGTGETGNSSAGVAPAI